MRDKLKQNKKNINNITLDLSLCEIYYEDLDWDKYSREIFDSIPLVDDDVESEYNVEGINPFIEDLDTPTFTVVKDDEITLEKSFINSWDMFKVKELQRIAEYYEIPYKGKTKDKLIEKIIEFEGKEENCMKVYDREVKWNTMNELCKDKFFNKFIINWNI